MASRSVTAQDKGAAQRAKFQQNSAWEQAQFVNRELTETEQRACKDWDYTESDMAGHLTQLCSDLYKATFRWDEFNNCHGCWLMPPKDHPDNRGMILTGRGSSPFKAFKQLMYKHFVLFTEQWPQESDRRGGQEIDD